jgi:acetyl-CoA acyltransferase
MRTTRNACIVRAARSPIGKFGGALREVRPDDLSAIVMKAIMTGIPAGQIEDILWGCANQAGEDNRNVGRMSALLAGFPYSVPASTVNRLCGSSLDALTHGARAIWSGDADMILTGGVESMSRAPYSLPKTTTLTHGNLTAYDTALGWRYPNPKMTELFPLESMGETAENLAEKYQITREEQDAFACDSHRKAIGAMEEGRFASELVPVEVITKGIRDIVDKDEGPRTDTSLEKLAALKPAFRKNGTVTAGNSSSLNDGAAAVLLMSEEKAGELNLKPLARVVSTGVAGVDPRYMGIGPVPATRIALGKAGLTMEQIDIVELNEAFAAQSIAVIRELSIPLTKLNPSGGAIALGHPLGCSGARIVTTLVHEMRRRNAQYGLATMCIGVGQGIAAVIERMR